MDCEPWSIWGAGRPGRVMVAHAGTVIAQAWQGRYEDAMRGTTAETLPQRLNDVGYVAMLRGDLDIAQTLFLKAIAASPTYHKVAHQNLEQVERLRSGGAIATPAVYE